MADFDWKGRNVYSRELITLGGLDDTIENENIAVGLRLEDENVLVLGLFDVKDLLDPMLRIGPDQHQNSRRLEFSTSSLESHSLAY